MKLHLTRLALASMICLSLTSCGGRCIRTAQDVTPGNPRNTKMDWRYGAADLRIQTNKLTCSLMDRWFSKAGWHMKDRQRPRLVITQIDNRTNQYISSEMIRDIFEETAANDGRYTVVVGNTQDEKELDRKLDQLAHDPKYSSSTRLEPCDVTAPQFLVKVRLTKAVTSDPCYDYEDYRMTVTLYDIQTQEIVDSASDTLRKKVQGF